MSAGSSRSGPLEVVVAGGGVAGLEASLALRELAGDAVKLTLLAPEPDFVYRPMAVREPFAFARALRFPLAEIAAYVDAELVRDTISGVDVAGRQVHLAGGGAHRFDALVLGLGAELRARYRHAVTVDDKRLDEQLHGLIQDVEEGYVKRLAFVLSAPLAWPLPAYELALMTGRRAYDMNIEVAITILTPEDEPLAVFGDGASHAVAELLAERGIELITSAYCEIPSSGSIEITPGDRRLEVDRVVALPQLHGPGLPGLPEAPDGFIPVDENCQVRGAERVYAAGDATDFAVKFGGIAAQQADTAAYAIAALAGALVQPQPFHPVIQAVLLTGERPLYFRAHITGGHGFGSEVVEGPHEGHTPKIAAKYLAPYIASHN
jgi:sulfide:quinone oxidoreductase